MSTSTIFIDLVPYRVTSGELVSGVVIKMPDGELLRYTSGSPAPFVLIHEILVTDKVVTVEKIIQ